MRQVARVFGGLSAALLSVGLSVSLWAGWSGTALAATPKYEPAPRFDAVGVGAIPRAVVASLAEDRDGQLWLGTGDGLVRFDGYRFRPVERASPDPAARNLGWVRALLPARDGRVWIGTESDGLVRHDPADDRITTYPIAAGRPSPTILALAEDGDGAVWVGTVGAGLLRFDPASSTFASSRRVPESGGLPDARVQALRVDRAGTLWVGTWQGLSRKVRGSDRFESVFSSVNGRDDGPTLAGDTVQALFEASDGRIWVGTQQGRLAVIDPATLSGQLLGPAATDIAERQGAVVDFVEAPDGQVWVGRETGIDVHAVDDGRRLRSLRHDVRKPGGLAANHVTSLLTDRAGAIWVGGLGGGLQRHDPNNKAIWLRDAEAGGPFEHADVRSLLVLDNGEVWAATHQGGVTVMDAGLNVVGGVVLPSAAGLVSAAPWRVNAMAQARDGSVWLGGDAELRQVNKERRLLRNTTHGGGLTHHLLSAFDGSLWAGTQDGLYRLRPGAVAPERVLLADGAALPGDVFVLAEAADGALWVGGVKGLFRVAPGGNTLQPVQAEAGAGLGNPVVIGLLIDSRQTLWVDTAVTGLHRLVAWDGRRARFDPVSARHGVVNRPFGVNLLEDRRGRIWSHLYVHDPGGDHLDELTAADGVSLGTGWFRSYAKTADGRLLFGGSKGLMVVEPERFDVSTFAPALIATDLRINGQSRPAGNFSDGLQLTTGDRSFALGFAALDYSDPGRVRYAYQLRGFDPEWISTGADSRSASYSNLAPGPYVLHVRATNRNGLWSPRELAIRVQVLPAWWQTGWSWLAALALLSLALYGVLRFYTRQLHQRQRALALKVQERTADLQAVTEALQLESAALAEASLTDPLTGLRNRRFLAQRIDADIALALRRHQTPAPAVSGATSPAEADLIFFLVDIDLFKQVNDQLGHAAGDAVIRQMRDRLRQVFRDSDHLVRWGGEEFLIVARSTSRAHAADLAERARAAVADRPFVLDNGAPLVKTCSVGFCCFPLAPSHPGALSWSETVNLADSALYGVKRSGRNGWLGLLSAHSASPESLQARARGPLAEWHRSGEVEVVAAPAHASWHTAGLA